jgi:hypothetical protein
LEYDFFNCHVNLFHTYIDSDFFCSVLSILTLSSMVVVYFGRNRKFSPENYSKFTTAVFISMKEIFGFLSRSISVRDGH